MEKLFGLLILIATSLFVNGDRLAGLEKKVVGMEMSLHQDIVMLRNSIQSINEKLDIVLNFNMPELQHELDKPTSTSDDNVRPEQIPLNTHNIQTEIRRFRRAFTALKHDFKSSVELEQNKLTNSVTSTRDKIDQTLQKVTDKVLAMTSDIHFNVLTFINETNNRTLSLVETATNERLALVEDIKNITTKFDATEDYTVRNNELNKDILSSVRSLKANHLISLLLLSKQHNQTLYKHLHSIYHEANCNGELSSCSEINTFFTSYDDIITDLDNIRLGDYTFDSFNTVKGRVEVYYSHTWGTVCDDLFHDSNTGAEVVCRQLGLTGGTPILAFGSGVGPIWLDDVKCTGTETNIFDCPRHSNKLIGSNDCVHREDVGVECTIPDDLKSLYQN